jgi:hypothetical protein
LKSILLGAVIVIVAAGASRGDVLIGVQAGAGYLRFGELEDFWDEVGLSHHTDDLAFQWEVSATWRLAARHALRVSVERLTTSVALHTASDFGAPFGMAFLYSDQSFDTVPISLGYEFVLRGSERGASTLAGVGVGYYMTELEGEEVTYSDDPLLVGSLHHSREGDGYGFHGYLRQTAPVSNRLSLSGMLRGRWVDAMAFDDDGDIPVDFTDFDFAVGLEWQI